MQDILTREPVRTWTGTVSLEWAAYALILFLALILRLADLDTVPLSEGEARQALTAFRAVNPQAAGSPLIAESPLLFSLNAASFATFGASETSARIWTVIAGMFVVMSPLLFHALLGRTRTLLFTLLLACSPVLLAASRASAPVVWAVVATIIGLWALWRWWQTGAYGWTLLFAASAATLLLLSDPAGFVLALILVGAAVIALIWEQSDDPDTTLTGQIRARLSEWRWGSALLVGALVVVLVSTGFMLYLPGLSAVSQLIGTGAGGLVNPRPDAPLFYPLLTTLFYEPVLWLFGILAVWLQSRRGSLTLLERFFAAWLVLAGAASLVYRGAGPEHALWLVLPALALASWTFAYLLEDVRHPFLPTPFWSRPLLTVGMIALLLIFTINMQSVARAVLRTQDGSLFVLLESYVNTIASAFSRLSTGQPVLNLDAANLIWALIALALMALGGFMAANVWGTSITLRGGALGLLVFGMITSLGSGWDAAVTNASSPVELWHVRATGPEYFTLRQTLAELSERESGGFPRLPIAALVPDDGIVAWALRDYTGVVYISDISEARGQEIVLAPQLAEAPDLGGNYVGQFFILTRRWSLQSMQGFDFLAWWLQRRTRLRTTPDTPVVLWLRQDIYNGVPFDPRQ